MLPFAHSNFVCVLTRAASTTCIYLQTGSAEYTVWAAAIMDSHHNRHNNMSEICVLIDRGVMNSQILIMCD